MIQNTTTIGEISTVVTKGTTPTTLGMAFTDYGIHFVKAEALNGDSGLDKSGFSYIDNETHEILRRSILEEDDILVTIAGAQIGKCGYVTPEILPANTNQAVGIVRVNQTKAIPRFVYYFFKQPNTFQTIQSIGCGQAAQPNLNLSNLKNIRLLLPPLHQQKKISELLFAYDFLIEKNRRRMALLEESARLLYREWFVRLRFPGHEHTRVVDSVPKGWQRGCVADFYQTASGGTPSRNNPSFFTGETCWVKTQELLNGFVFDTEEKITDEAINRSAAKIFPDRTVLVAMYGATIGQIGILACPAASNQACCAVMPLDERASYIHAFLFFRENKENLVGLSQGAAQNNVNQQIIRSFPMLMPHQGIMEVFNETLFPVFEQWLNLQRQNQKLQTARDLLLPRLMSGEISV